jgi:3-methyladenine DNA glycosylase/8-oxoguanine DNA glycosylase
MKSKDDMLGLEMWVEARGRVSVFPVHFARTFSLQRMGPYDPTALRDGDCFRKAFYYRGKVAGIEICRDGGELAVCACGEDAEPLLEETIAGLLQEDRYFDFAIEDPGVLRLHGLFPGLRILRFPWLYDMSCSAILQQRIRTVDAMRDWRRIAQRWGGDGPWGLRAFPAAAVMAAVPRFELERMGVDAKRAAALLRFAREQKLVGFKAGMEFATIRQLLMRVPGIGGWTTETVLGYGAGDTDAVIPADLHLPRVVCYALAGEFKGTDERMMELLEPFRGHRFRVIRLIYESHLDVPW